MRALLLAVLIGFGCNTPSVPIPPPLVSALKFQNAPTAGEVVIAGVPTLQHADVRFYVFNTTNGEGVIVTAAHDGSFSSDPFPGSDGDLVDLYYDTQAGDRSGDACVTLRIGATLFTTLCQ